MDGAADDICNQLTYRRELRERKRSLKSLNRVHSSLKRLKLLLCTTESNEKPNMRVLERIVSEYNQIQFHISRCQNDISESDLQVSFLFQKFHVFKNNCQLYL